MEILDQVLRLFGRNNDDAVKRLVDMGYPEHTAKKIAAGDLPMDEASIRKRQLEQDFDPDTPLYHGTAGADIKRWNEDMLGYRDPGDFGKGIYTTPSKEFARSYAQTAANEYGLPANVMELRSATKAREVPYDVKYAQRGKALGDREAYIEGGKRIKSESLGSGMTGTSLVDPKGNVVETAHYRTQDVRSPYAAYDPENRDKPYVMGLTGSKPDVGGGLMSAISSGAAYMPSDDTDYGEDAVSGPNWDDIKNVPEEVWQNMNALEKAALLTSVVPGLGTATGVVSDLYNMYDKPEERTLTNALLLASNFVPAAKVGEVFGIINKRTKLPEDKEIDPRYAYSQTRKGDVERTAATTREKIETGTQDVPEMSIFDQEGRGFVTSMSDRTDAGGVLTKVNDVELKRPVDLLGGQGYMFENPGQVWASDKGPVSSIMKQAEQVKKATGQDPLYLPYRMAPTGGDYSHLTGETMLAVAESALSRSDKASLNKKMKELIPDWNGINSPKAMQQFRDAPGDVRKKVIQMMDRDFREIGGITGGEARVAVSEASQLAAREGGLQNVGLIDVLEGRVPRSGHPSYEQGIRGEGLGRLKEDIPVYSLLPRKANMRGIKDPANPSQQDLRAMQMGASSGIITEGVLKQLEELLKRQK
jgi:hypothetical protein